ncbi:PulJ/GspJ family protein [Flavobacterium davisii]|uniref:Prepilin-type N-terminal cleavage/methylation domain-containing protein n=1 Tax=Flavobacterium columnare TaxID=996 RepID=A0A8G0KQ93_9FLAO|nr:prepilin-type N-terminal cleavage/methylation domain-containing protein [Flavobacterium davisii]QYS88056.1 prepilin-type N-terminal cleavage/methylation domain-containing protein [Flavobacterium davisii]
MKKNNPYLKAFSLLEAIVSMAIAAIIMGLTFVIFSMITERMLDYKKQNQATHDVNRLTYSLHKDIFDSDKMEFLENQLHFSNYTGSIVRYYWEEHYIIRRNETFVDTFDIAVKHFQIDSLHNRSGKLHFQKIKMKISSDSLLMDLNFYKPIFAQDLIQKKYKDEF